MNLTAKFGPIGTTVCLSLDGSNKRIPSMANKTGYVIEDSFPENNWVLVKWSGLRQNWTEHKSYLILKELSNHETQKKR